MASVREKLARIYELADMPGRIPAMEGARGLAIILVFFVHYRSLFADLYAPDPSMTVEAMRFAGKVGNTGVDLFFVLSGFLIYGAVIRRPIDFFAFMRRRVQRIYPPFLAMLAVYLVLSALMPAQNKIPRELGAGALYIVENVFLLPGMVDIPPIIAVAWSLSYEFFYYLMIPILVAVTGMRSWSSRSRVIFFLALSIIGLVLSGLVSPFYVRLVMFGSGILLYEAMQSKSLRASLGTGGEWVAIALSLAVLPLTYIVEMRPDLVGFLPGLERFWPSYKVIVMFVGFLGFSLFAFGRKDGILSRIFSFTPLRWMGNISYSYYLLHGLAMKFILIAVGVVFPPHANQAALTWILIPIVMLGTLLSATVLFLIVERPFSLSAVRPHPAPHPAPGKPSANQSTQFQDAQKP